MTRVLADAQARLRILRYGDPRLEADNAPVTDFDEELSGLIKALFKAGWKAPGLGLAAPQVGVNLRLAVVDLSVGEDPAARMVIANPEIVRSEGKVVLEEGCLSFPGLFTTLSRPRRVWVVAEDEKGRRREIEADGLLAQALCHEVDHLDGVLLVHHLSGIKRRLFLRRVQKLRALDVW